MIGPDKREDSLYYGDQTRWRTEHPLLADDLSKKDLDRLGGFKFRYYLESRGFSSNQAMALLFLRWDVNRRFGVGLNKREIIENDKDWQFPKDDSAKAAVNTHDKPYEPSNPSKYLSPLETDRLTGYKLRYSLESRGFSRKQAEKLLDLKRRRSQGNI